MESEWAALAVRLVRVRKTFMNYLLRKLSFVGMRAESSGLPNNLRQPLLSGVLSV